MKRLLGLSVMLINASSIASAQTPLAIESLRLLAGAAGEDLPGAPAVQAPAFSKSYKEVARNNDGSVTIVEPFYNHPTKSGTLPISSDSNRDGVCKLFGMGAYRAHISVYGGETFALIGADAKITALQEDSGVDHWRLQLTICESGAAPVPALPSIKERVDGVRQNDDGTVSLLGPYVSGGTGVKLRFQDNNERGHICAYYGLGALRLAQSSKSDALKMTVNDKGKLAGRSNDGKQIDSIVCDQAPTAAEKQ